MATTKSVSTAGRGRPRGFALEDALDRAVEVFWRYGYEGASLAQLTSAMRVNKPSMYTAFGNKEELFHRAVARYAETEMTYMGNALQQETAYRVAESFLIDNAEALTRDGRPRGCLSIQGGLACAPEDASVPVFLAASRMTGEQALAERFAVAKAAGDLPSGIEPDVLARYLMAVTNGHAVHAAAGVGRAELVASAQLALRGLKALFGSAAE